METRYHHQLLLHGVHHKVQSVAHRRSRAEQARLQELLGTSSASANVPRKRVYVEATAAESVADVMEDFVQRLGSKARELAWKQGRATVRAEDFMEAKKTFKYLQSDRSKKEEEEIAKEEIRQRSQATTEADSSSLSSSTGIAGKVEPSTYSQGPSLKKVDFVSAHMPPLPPDHTYYHTPMGYSRLAHTDAHDESTNSQKWLTTFSHFLDAHKDASHSRKRPKIAEGERPEFDPYSAPSIPIAFSGLRSASQVTSLKTADAPSVGTEQVKVPHNRLKMANAPSSVERSVGRTADAQNQLRYHRQEMILRGKPPDTQEEEQEANAQNQEADGNAAASASSQQ